MSKVLDKTGLAHYDEKIKEYISEHGGEAEVYIGTNEPTGDEKVWINPDGEVIEPATKDYVDGEIDRVEEEVDTKSAVSVSATGTATDEVQYITVDGVEKKLAGGGGSSYTFTNGLTETEGVVGTDNTVLKTSGDYQATGTIGIGTLRTNEIQGGTLSSQRNSKIQLQSSSISIIPDRYSSGNSVTFNKNYIGVATNNAIDIGTSASKFKNGYFAGTLEAQNLSDGTTTKTMTEVLAGGGGGGSSYTAGRGIEINDNIIVSNNTSGLAPNLAWLRWMDSIHTDGYMTTVSVTNEEEFIKYLQLGMLVVPSTGFNVDLSKIFDNTKDDFSSCYLNNNLVWTSFNITASKFTNYTLNSNNLYFKVGNSFGYMTSGNTATSKYNILAYTIPYYSQKFTHYNLGGILDEIGDKIPAPPTTDGEYNLHCSIVDGVPTYTWKAEV